jgi:hypothetical protein
MNFKRRTKTIKAPEVEDTDIFPEGSEKEFVIQNLYGQEIAFARERVNQNKAIDEVIRRFLADRVPDIVEAIQEKLGLSDILPGDYVNKIAMVEFGVQSPKMTQEKAVRLGRNYPVTFYNLANEITALTAMGSLPGE